MKKIINAEHIEGRLYQHNLVVKTVKNTESKNYGREFISGTIDIATDEQGLNVIPIHYTYVTKTTSKGKKNFTYTVLKSIIDGASTWVTDGKDAAMKLRINTSLGLNDFYNANDELVSAKRNEGGFVNVIKDLCPEDERNTFRMDMVITSVTRVEADEEKNIDKDYLKIRGAVFDGFRGDILPVEFTCRYELAFDYFENTGASPKEPVFTEVRGHIINTTIERKIEEESAFGTVSVRTVPYSFREWAIDWVKPTEYDFGADDVLTADDLRKAMQDREVYLASVKKQRDEFLAARAADSASPTPAANLNNAMNVPDGDFNF